MAKPDYTKLDQLILAGLAKGPRPFSSLNAEDIEDETRVLVAGSDVDAFRVLDRRLQALRKAGKIEFIDARNGWKLKERA